MENVPRADESSTSPFEFWRESFTKPIPGGGRVWAALLSLLFGFAQMVGWRIENTGTLGVGGAASLAILMVEILLAAAVFALFVFPLIRLAVRFQGWRRPASAGLWALQFGKRWAIVGAILAFAWLPYWVFLWPGVVTSDSVYQLAQATGQVPYTDHHPVVMTLLLQSVFVPLKALTGSFAWTLGLVSLFQLVVIATLVSLCVNAWVGLDAPRWLLNVSLALFALFPMVGWYSVTLWKDVWLSIFLLCFVTSATVIVHRVRSHGVGVGVGVGAGTRTGAGSAVPGAQWVLLALSVFAVCIAKKTGMYIAVPVLFACLLVASKAWRNWLVVTVVSVGSFVGLHAGMMAVTDAVPGTRVEALAIPLQQIGRTVRDSPQVLTDEDVAIVDRYFPHQKPAELYDPRTSDGMKGSSISGGTAIDRQEVDEDTGSLLRLWGRLAPRAPLAYTEALLATTSGYWYPGTVYPLVFAHDWVMAVNQNEALLLPVAGVAPEVRTNPKPLQQMAQDWVNVGMRHAPVLGWMSSLGAWAWASVFLGVVALMRRSALAVPAFFTAALVWFTCMISPVFAEARYAYPLLLLLPLLVVATLASKPRTVEGGEESELSPRVPTPAEIGIES